MSNFTFLQDQWPLLHESATKAEDLVHTDAHTACFYARRTLELAVAWLYKHERSLRLPYQENLSALIHEPSFAQLVGQAVYTKTKLIKELGNQAVHSTRKVLPADAVVATRELFHTCYWLTRTYGQRGRPDPGLSFDAALLARPAAAAAAAAAPPQTPDQLQKLQAQLAERDERLSTLLGTTAALDAELTLLRAEVAAAKLANAAIPDTHDYSEAQTRDDFIDLLLKEAGWQLDRLRRGQALTPTDLLELERMLADAGGTPELIQKATQDKLGLGIFIRSLVGMEREAVAQAFSEVIAGTQATPDQIEFIELIVSELTTNGAMEAGRLYESPFLDISPQGPEELFPTAKVDRMVQVLDEIRQRATA